MSETIQDQSTDIPDEIELSHDNIELQAPSALEDAAVDPDMALEEMAAAIEALLFSSDAPLSAAKLGTIAELPQRCVTQSIKALNERYEESHSTFRIVEIAGGYQLQTQPEYYDILRRLFHVRKNNRLTQAAMETLAIVAYRQPILRADIEAVRGVASGEMLRNLMERGLVKIVGRAEVIGRPMLYGTTKKFLEVFGLVKLADLPKADELRSPASKPAVLAEDAPLFVSEPEETPPAVDIEAEVEDLPPVDLDGEQPADESAAPAPLAPAEEDDWDEELEDDEDEFDDGEEEADE